MSAPGTRTGRAGARGAGGGPSNLGGRGDLGGGPRGPGRTARAAAVLALAVLGAAGVGGCQPTPSPSPSGTATPSATPTPDETTPAPRAPVSAVVATIDVGADATAIVLVPEAGSAFVANASDGTLSVIDLATDQVTDTIEVGTRVAGLAIDPTTNVLYVTDVGGVTDPPPPAVVVVDIDTLSVVDTIDVGSQLFARIALDPGRERAYVLGEDAGDSQSVRVIDTAARQVVDTITFAGLWTAGPLIDPAADRLYLTDYAGGVLHVVDLDTLEVRSGDPISEPPPTGLSALAVDAERLYLSEFEGPLHVVDTGTLGAGTLDILTSIPMGEGVDATVSGVVLDADAGVAYVLKSRAGQVDVVDTTSYEVVDTIDVGGQPSSGTVDPATGRLYVVDGYANTVTVLGTA